MQGCQIAGFPAKLLKNKFKTVATAYLYTKVKGKWILFIIKLFIKKYVK